MVSYGFVGYRQSQAPTEGQAAPLQLSVPVSCQLSAPVLVGFALDSHPMEQLLCQQRLLLLAQHLRESEAVQGGRCNDRVSPTASSADSRLRAYT